MAVNKIGWSGLSGRSKRYNSDFLTTLADSTSTITVARVTDILINNNSKNFGLLGEWNGLGVIQYETLATSLPNNRLENQLPISVGLARPLESNIKKFPLINELVYIIVAPNTNMGDSPYSVNAYYISTLSLWNHPHHNAFPSNPNVLPPSQQKDYIQTQAGSVRRVTDKSTEIKLGDTFKERANIHPLLPFEGDIIVEGRWGNSIRFGSTVKNNPNNWSEVGTDGDPITIIRNGQGLQSEEGWIPVTEDINNVISDICLTSTQKVPIKVASTNYYSYDKNPPTNPGTYTNPQIILNSGRLLLNSTSDHILLSSAKSINLNSKSSINIDSPKLSVKANNIYLGENSNFDKNEPLVLGNQTANLLKKLVNSLSTFMQIASTATTSPCVPALPSTLPTINSAAQDVLDDLYNLSRELGSDPNLKDCNIVSKRNYTV